MIYKVVISEAGTLNKYVDPTIFCDRKAAREYAMDIVDGGWWEDKEVDSVTVYKEGPDPETGMYKTFGQERFI